MSMDWLFHTSAPSSAPFWFSSTQTSYSPIIRGCDHTKVAGRSPSLPVVAEAVATALAGKASAPSGINILVLMRPVCFVVGPPGFEPESRESKSQSLDQASRRPHSLHEQRNHQIRQSLTKNFLDFSCQWFFSLDRTI